ncbi:Activating signal cointegrator 1 complex subunit 1 [Strongyloides ratti]|uniref:Activating signal cointegrator 1 complex subunit 1 n=1 Tax=Strongyloides ratti TaxID=34506 RepID=A0A090MZ44_STRRB|nr:Activating signal cointegrator 1 complex subunit 1 [Strongyloides ratti]CEF68289.1 Activating signal cointegrator 1 complex subunit 1 [Strongyloides ratti]
MITDGNMLYKVDNRIYRRNPYYVSKSNKNEKLKVPLDLVDDTKYDTERECWYIKFSIPIFFYGKIIGAKGVSRSKIERKFGCKIFVPEKDSTSNEIEVISKVSYENVERCKEAIDEIVTETRNKMPFSHFVSFSFWDNSELQKKFLKFIERAKIFSGLEDEYFQLPNKLHITICMATLVDEMEEKIVINCLKNVIDKMVKPLLGGKSVKIQIKGFSVMNDDPKKANVLYGKVDCPVLQNIGEEINNELKKTGLCVDDKSDLKLHLTLINTTFLKGKNKKDKTFDGTKIIEKLNDFDFGEIEFSKITLNKRFTSEDDGSYTIIHEESFV